ncbi:choice-of-anchor B family protein [Kordia sp. YSTF-M3]|uniref:Choice-of-anchor B family protein n=1 Tax=Kordia aestuariivivens TaxID=2759037 RepID=A0ABR7Q765_9FLAO|nr:choice-of-anchor B family protein [Kordia aestuariivivens]MBC8754400.1 choice-of-anchor B family protein [Kordia aestuariivivens]
MKKYTHILTAVVAIALFSACANDDDAPITVGQTPNSIAFPNAVLCENGLAGQYSCDGYDLMSTMPLSIFGASKGNDSWGWTDPQTGKEYVLMGTDENTSFVDITNPTDPIYLGKLPTATVASSWRDVKVYNNHAFVVSEAPGHGMQVFDLTRLRNVTNAPEIFTADAWYDGFGSAHNIVINETSGFAYAVGAMTLDDSTFSFSGGPHFVNIQNPTNPVAAGGYPNDAYSHDAQVVTYNGPDTEHIGKELLIGSNTNEVVIVDISDKNNPIQLSTIAYTDIGYTHQGWFTEDQRYFIVGDELDEINTGFNSRSIVFDFQDLDNPSVKMSYTGPTTAIDHNGYAKGDTFFLANYTAGVRILDISNIDGNLIEEIGFFDTFPTGDQAIFSGAWNIYPYFESGNIVVSDINSGLFIIRKSTD